MLLFYEVISNRKKLLARLWDHTRLTITCFYSPSTHHGNDIWIYDCVTDISQHSSFSFFPISASEWQWKCNVMFYFLCEMLQYLCCDCRHARVNRILCDTMMTHPSSTRHCRTLFWLRVLYDKSHYKLLELWVFKFHRM